METLRRQTLIDRFDGARPRWLSLDVFDTLLSRRCAQPTDLFLEVHSRLAASGACTVTARRFRQMRVDAEAAARRSRPSGETDFDSICAELARALGGRLDAATLATCELGAERDCVELDRDVAALLAHAAATGVPYVLVSDMYLRGEHLLELLAAAAARAGIELPAPAHVFVSGERGVNKGGSMFGLVLQTLGCAPAELLHVGDHPVADVESPRRQGIVALHYFQDTPYARRVLADEDRRLPAALLSLDSALRKTRTRALRAAQAKPDDPLTHFHYGAFVLGPVLSAYAEWVVADCEARAQSTVYCLMREGHLLAPLVARAAQALRVSLDVRRLWVSRYALRGASFLEASSAELDRYFDKRHPVALSTVARDLGVDVGLLRRHSGVAHDQGLSGRDRERVTGALSGDPALRVQLLASAAAKRRRLFAYFESSGVFARQELTLVDLGWGASLQKALALLFARLPRPAHLRALYLATSHRLRGLPIERCSAASFLFHLGAPSDTYAPLQRSPELMEHACMPPQGSLAGFGDDRQPVTFEHPIARQQTEQIAALQRGILHFAAQWFAGAAERRAGTASAGSQARLERLRVVLARSIDAPLAEEVALFEHWMHDANDGCPTAEPLLGSDAVRARARGMSYDQIRRLSWLDCYWPQGLALSAGKRDQGWARRLLSAVAGRG